MNLKDSEKVAQDIIDNLPRRMAIQWIGTIIWRFSEQDNEFNKAVKNHLRNIKNK